MATQNNNTNVIASQETIASKVPKKLVPQLRFKEFDGEWERKKLGEISSKIAYGMNAAATTFDGKHKYLRITDIDEETREFIPNPLTSPDGFIEDKFKMKLNDIVFARTGASTGKSYLYNPKDGNLYFAGFLIKFNLSKANSYFVYSQTFKESYKKWVQVYSMRSGQPGLNAEEYKNLKLNLPSLPEQQKIAQFLTAVDSKLQQLNQKKERLAQYKKGVMQQLFSQQLRFKKDDGSDYPDWERIELGDILEYEQPTKYIVDSTEYNVEYQTPVLTAGKSFILGYTNEETGIFEENLPVIIFDDFTTAFKYVDFRFKVKSSAMKILKIVSEDINIKFVFEAMKLIKFPLAEHKRYWISEYQYMKIPYPSKEEQQKIASYLSAIDTKIETVTQQIEGTQQFKKGLLQQMFV